MFSLKVESTCIKALRYTGYVASFGITYIVRQVKKKKQMKSVLVRQTSVESMFDDDWVSAENLMFNSTSGVAAASHQNLEQQQQDEVMSILSWVIDDVPDLSRSSSVLHSDPLMTTASKSSMIDPILDQHHIADQQVKQVTTKQQCKIRPSVELPLPISYIAVEPKEEKWIFFWSQPVKRKKEVMPTADTLIANPMAETDIINLIPIQEEPIVVAEVSSIAPSPSTNDESLDEISTIDSVNPAAAMPSEGTKHPSHDDDALDNVIFLHRPPLLPDPPAPKQIYDEYDFGPANFIPNLVFFRKRSEVSKKKYVTKPLKQTVECNSVPYDYRKLVKKGIINLSPIQEEPIDDNALDDAVTTVQHSLLVDQQMGVYSVRDDKPFTSAVLPTVSDHKRRRFTDADESAAVKKKKFAKKFINDVRAAVAEYERKNGEIILSPHYSQTIGH